MKIPVITIDGPSASGKGTVAALLASRLGFYYLDSGSLYRLLALCAYQHHIELDDEQALAGVAYSLPVVFDKECVWLDGQDVGDAIRCEHVAEGASKIAVLPLVRTALLDRQRAFCQSPGLVTDGRDMGSVVFPNALLKIFLTASTDIRAERRYKQLRGKGESATILQITQDMIERDKRDAARSLAPLRKESDAMLLDTSAITVTQAVDQLIVWFEQRCVCGL